MKIGLNSLMQNIGAPETDGEAIAAELELALRAEELGFDSVWAVEHHFSGYSIQPNPLLWLTYLAARTERILLGSAVIVLPWHNPTRVAGEISMLDHLCGGRFVAGIGRGLGRLEFEGLGASMETSRAVFAEGIAMIDRAMKTGELAANGEVVKQPRRSLRPHPRASLEGRLYASTVSPESAAAAARLGVGILINPQKPWSHIAEDMAAYRDEFARHHEGPAPRPIASCQVYVHEDAAVAEEVARREIGRYYASVMAHYEMTGEHFDSTAGYEYYARLSAQLQNLDRSDIVDRYLKTQVFGDPEQCVAKIASIVEVTGADHFIGLFRFSELSREQARASTELFAREVIPAIRQLDPDPAPAI
jgi:alkanesulfonate monooxygenase SsuD/methylene tetrahydromethanopterin reductase-like flavin-dependent oxidoreductase (luciferase family)